MEHKPFWGLTPNEVGALSLQEQLERASDLSSTDQQLKPLYYFTTYNEVKLAVAANPNTDPISLQIWAENAIKDGDYDTLLAICGNTSANEHTLTAALCAALLGMTIRKNADFVVLLLAIAGNTNTPMPYLAQLALGDTEIATAAAAATIEAQKQREYWSR